MQKQDNKIQRNKQINKCLNIIWINLTKMQDNKIQGNKQINKALREYSNQINLICKT